MSKIMGMAKQKPLIFLYPINDTLESIKGIIQKDAEENNVEIFEISDIKEMAQVIPSLGQALVITAGAKSCIMMLQECRRYIKKKNTKVVLLSQKQINRKITDKMMKMGLTELITEPVAQKTILYKINLLIRSLEIESDDKGPRLKSLEGGEDKRSNEGPNNLINNNDSPIEVNLTEDEADRPKGKNKKEKELNQEKVKRLLQEQERKKRQSNEATNNSKLLADSPLEVDLSEEVNKRKQSPLETDDRWQDKTGLKSNQTDDDSSAYSINLDDEKNVKDQNENSKRKQNSANSNQDLEDMENTLNAKQAGQDIIEDDIHKMRNTEFSHGNMIGDVDENESALNSMLKGSSSGGENLDGDNLEGQLKKQNKIDNNLKGLLSDSEDQDGFMSGDVHNQGQDEGHLKGSIKNSKGQNGPLRGRDSLLQDDDGILQGEIYSKDKNDNNMLQGDILTSNVDQDETKKNKSKFEEKRESYFKGLLSSNSASEGHLEGSVVDNELLDDHYSGGTINDDIDDFESEDDLLNDIDSLNDKLSSNSLLIDDEDSPYGSSFLNEAQNLKNKLASKSSFREKESEFGNETDYQEKEIEKFYKSSMLHDDGLNGGYKAAQKRKEALRKNKNKVDLDTYFEDIYGTKADSENKKENDEEDYYSTGPISLDKEKDKKKTEDAYVPMANKAKNDFDIWDDTPIKKHEYMDSEETSENLDNHFEEDYGSTLNEQDESNDFEMEDKLQSEQGSEDFFDGWSSKNAQDDFDEDMYKKDESENFSEFASDKKNDSEQSTEFESSTKEGAKNDSFLDKKKASELSMEEIHQNKDIPVSEEQFATLFSEDAKSNSNSDREDDENVIDYNKIRKQFNKGNPNKEILLENKAQVKENFERIKREIESKKDSMQEESTAFPPIIKGIEYCVKASHWTNLTDAEDIDLLNHISQVMFDKLAGICCFFEFNKNSNTQTEIFIGHNKLFNSIELLDQEINWSKLKEDFLEKWKVQTLPYWHDEDFNSAENHFFYPFYEGSAKLGYAVIDFQDHINPEYAKAVEVIVSMGRSYYLRNTADLPSSEKQQEKNNNFFGKIFSRKKA